VSLDNVRRAVAGRSVLVTGHSGFKGSWLTLWLDRLGARVTGLSLPPDQPDALFTVAGVADHCASHWVDIRDEGAVAEVVRAARPDLVLHLAAQPLVRRGFREPLLTFATNIMGTANVLEAARGNGARACVCVTTDKVYATLTPHRPCRETDALGGSNPYGASKAAAELVAACYMLAPDSRCQIATARGGNVLGGGDWAEDRVVPDLLRAMRGGTALTLRNPLATRPWQHVLDLCFGYLLLAARLLDGWPERGMPPAGFRGAWNFGPAADAATPVSELVAAMRRALERPPPRVRTRAAALPEAPLLSLDSTKATGELGWHPALPLATTIDWTARWYRGYLADPADAARLTREQIAAYCRLIEPAAAAA
jgi:CDP-glucose 4,6-dehydratase